MRKRPGIGRQGFFVLLAAGFLLSGPAWAETVELVTYYPTSSNQGDLRGNTLAISGGSYQNTGLTAGQALIETGLGIGPGFNNGPGNRLTVIGTDDGMNSVTFFPGLDTPANGTPELRFGLGTLGPIGVMDVRGAAGIADTVTFMPGTGGTLNVGIGTLAPQAPLQVGASNLFVQNDQGGSIELGGNGTIANPVAGGMPYIDFHFGFTNAGGATVAQNFNTRLINRADGILDVQTSTGGAAAQTRLSVGANIGVGTTTPQTTSPTGGATATSGNLDANDVYIRSTGRWASQAGGTQRPDAANTYVGNGTADRFIPLAFRPSRVLVWVRHDVLHVHSFEIYAGMPLVNADGVNETGGGFSFIRSDVRNDVRQTNLRIVAGENGFHVGGGSIEETNWASRTYRWMAWD